MRRALLALLIACGGNEDTPPPPGSASGSAPGSAAIDAGVALAPGTVTQCAVAIGAAPKTPAMRRVQTLLTACTPCGDWKPLLEWQTEAAEGGPKRAELEAALERCNPYCSKDAKTKFLGALDKDRGKGNTTRGPWRYLADICKGKVSAVPDNRYASAVWFALDRIGRAAATDPALAHALEDVDLPLPAISRSGYGYELPRSPVTAPDVGPLGLSITPKEIRVAWLPHGRLGKRGIATLTRGEPYPGVAVTTAAELDAAIVALEAAPIVWSIDHEAPDAPDPHAGLKMGSGSGSAAGSGSGTGSAPGTGSGSGSGLGSPFVPKGDSLVGASISIFAPKGVPAVRLLDVIALTGDRPRAADKRWLTGDVRLAVAPEKGLPGWALSGSVPVALRSKPAPGAITVALDDNPDAAVEELKKHKAALIKIAQKLHDKDAKDTSGGPSALLTNPPVAIQLGPAATIEGLAKLLGAAAYFDVKSVALVSAKR